MAPNDRHGELKERLVNHLAFIGSAIEHGVKTGRLPAEAYVQNFGDHEPPLDRHEARVAADRCYFCHDAPCITA